MNSWAHLCASVPMQMPVSAGMRQPSSPLQNHLWYHRQKFSVLFDLTLTLLIKTFNLKTTGF